MSGYRNIGMELIRSISSQSQKILEFLGRRIQPQHHGIHNQNLKNSPKRTLWGIGSHLAGGSTPLRCQGKPAHREAPWPAYMYKHGSLQSWICYLQVSDCDEENSRISKELLSESCRWHIQLCRQPCLWACHGASQWGGLPWYWRGVLPPARWLPSCHSEEVISYPILKIQSNVLCNKWTT